MPLIKKIIEEKYTLVVWNLTEDEDHFLPFISKFSTSPESLEEIHFPQRRREWLASRYIGWELAKEMQGSCDGIWSDSHNKPHFKNSSMQLSISHASPYVAVLVNKNMRCGVDIEEKKDKLIRLAPKFMTKPEIELAGDHVDTLALAWATKEAIYKLHGRKQLIFKENIVLNELPHQASGEMKSTLIWKSKITAVSLRFEYFGNHILVYTL